MAFPITFTNAQDTITEIVAAHINALEVKVGIDSSADPNSLDYKVAQAVKNGDSPVFDGLTVDTNTIYVDSVNHRVGIGTSTPGYPLEVNGSIFLPTNKQLLMRDVTAGIYSSGTNQISIFTSGGHKLTIDSSGNVTIPSIASGIVKSASGVLSALAYGSANTKLFVNAAGTAPEFAVGMKAISFTRDMTAASGNVSYTGVGFKPTTIIFFAAPANTPGMSIGYHDSVASLAGSIADLHVDVANSWYLAGQPIYMRTSAGTSQLASMASFDSDGFTLSWTKSGAPPAGTSNIHALCFR